MASVFWDAHGILFVVCLEKRKTINSDYYMTLLDRLSAEIKKTASHAKEKSAVPPCHKSIATMPKLHELHFELLPHSMLNKVEFLEKTVFCFLFVY